MPRLDYFLSFISSTAPPAHLSPTAPSAPPLPLPPPLAPNREEELLAAAEVPEGPECRRVQHAGERDLEADHPPGPGDGDDGGPQAVGHRDELHANVRQLHH